MSQITAASFRHACLIELLSLVVLLCVTLAGCGESDGSKATAAAATQGQPFETTLDRPVSETNPFDPAQIRIDGEFHSPAGEVLTIPAFVTRSYERSLVGGFEKLAPTSDLQWKVRFTPTEPGSWQWRAITRTAAGEEVGDWNDIDVEPATAFHGFVRRSERDPRYLEFDDATPFFAVGENMCWYDGRGTYSYDEWIARLAAQGGNYIRLWMPSWAFALEWIQRDGGGALVSSSLGNYTDRLNRAWQLDYVIELARQHGIQVMLSIQNHGAFSLSSNSEWADCPYNAANGGPLVQPREFFTDEEARELFKRRLRYIVGRWGYAPNIMTWELWNEVDLADQPSPTELLDWHREMAAELRTLDPYDRLISTSTSLGDALTPGATFNALWELDDIDYTQAHYYSFDGNPADFTQIFPRITRRLLRAGKPAFISEAGVDFQGPAETLEFDPEADGFHDILWSAVFSEAFGIGMSWWWDNVVDPEDLYFHFGPVAAFVRHIDFAGESFTPTTTDTTAPDGRPIRAFQLRGESTTLAWIKNRQHQWTNPDPEPVEGTTLVLGGFEEGTWQATWFETRSPETTTTTLIAEAGGQLTVAVPTFSRDIALKLVRENG
jgi:hypothetical protein